jgi:hypothetical protein
VTVIFQCNYLCLNLKRIFLSSVSKALVTHILSTACQMQILSNVLENPNESLSPISDLLLFCYLRVMLIAFLTHHLLILDSKTSEQFLRSIGLLNRYILYDNLLTIFRLIFIILMASALWVVLKKQSLPQLAFPTRSQIYLLPQLNNNLMSAIHIIISSVSTRQPAAPKQTQFSML